MLSFTPDNSTVVVGNTLTLNCTFEGDPLPSALWSHNKTILNVLSDPNLSETLLKSYALLDVTFADINDTGVYMCLVNNSFSFDKSDPSVFIVQGNKFMNKTSKDYYHFYCSCSIPRV